MTTEEIAGLSEADDLDLCECGDYRRDHVDGQGTCRHNKPRDLTHGYRDCDSFRLHRAAARALSHNPEPMK